MNIVLIVIGKIIGFISRSLNKGAGSTWPGHIALTINPNFLRDISLHIKTKIIFVAGTNGKTTTGKMIATILEKNGKSVFQNITGANLLNGIASSVITNSTIYGKLRYDYAIFEVDENTLPHAIGYMTPYAIILLNLFRDQLDRYGELDTIAKKWQAGLIKSTEKILILNADDPLIAYIGETIKQKPLARKKIIYFGVCENVNKKSIQHGSDNIYCRFCGNKLLYKAVTYSHLGNWHCGRCGHERPRYILQNITYPLVGDYNKYNAQAAAIFAKEEGCTMEKITNGLKLVTPVFGRQEQINVQGKNIQVLLSKNPTSFNQSLETAVGLGGRHFLFVLNDRIPDGRDVSWIWDTGIEDHLDKIKSIIVSGDRPYDMALRVRYSIKFKMYDQRTINKLIIMENLKKAIKFGLKQINKKETLYILPTYSAMLEVRKILTGKNIL